MIAGVLLGMVSVLQAGMNRRIGERTGLVYATLINNAVLLGASIALYFICRIWFRSATTSSPSIGSLPLWYLIPGTLGLVLVAGIPYVISQVGALRVFTPLIVFQVAGSLVWDMMLEGRELSLPRVTGAVVTCLGAILCQI
jgi:transporter family-2 protein